MMPDWKNEIRDRLSGLELAPMREDAIVEEVAQYLDDCYEAALSGGAPHAEAVRLALAELNDREVLRRGLRRVERRVPERPDNHRTKRGSRMLNDLRQDLRYGGRMLLKQPGFTSLAVLMLALGIGANTAIFSLINSVILRPLPFAAPEQLVWSWGVFSGGNRASTSPPDFLDFRAQNQTFSSLAAQRFRTFNLAGSGEPERILGASVTVNYFQTLDVKPVQGRAFLPEEEQQGRAQVAIISRGLWQRRFGGDPGIVGSTVILNGQNYLVVGVAPDEMQLMPGGAEIWTPIFFDHPDMKIRRFHFLRAVGRLKPGVTVAQAQTDLDTIAAGLEKLYPDSNTSWRLRLVPLQEQLVGNMRRPLFVLFGAVGFILLIACVNVANLLLAQAAKRQKEVALRHALGADRLRLVRQLLAESALLGICAGLGGLLLSWWGTRLLLSIAAQNIPRANEVKIDLRVLGFTLIVSLVTSILFGLAPAWRSSRPDLNEVLKEGGRGSISHSPRARNLLIIIEVAMALILLVGAGLLIRSFRQLQDADPGFDSHHLLTFRLFLSEAKYGEPGQPTAFYEKLLPRLEALPGAQDVGLSILLPPIGSGDTYFTIEGRPLADPRQKPTAFNPRVSHNFLRAMKVPVLKGRDFTAADVKVKPQTVIINEAFARTHFAGVDPIGQYLNIDMGEPWKCEIIGVARDYMQFSLQMQAGPAMYLPSLDAGMMGVVIRTSGDPLALVSAVRQAVKVIDPDQPIANLRTMDEALAATMGDARFRTLLLSIFAGIALCLSVIGIYGVIAYTVAQRTHEIGVRLALGAQPGNILKSVLGQGMKLVITGVGLGIAGAFAVTRVLSEMLFNVTATDPLTFIVISGLLILVAALACLIPAWRATKVDPLVALRYE
jgi:putative ABC transport system permease protein